MTEVSTIYLVVSLIFIVVFIFGILIIEVYCLYRKWKNFKERVEYNERLLTYAQVIAKNIGGKSRSPATTTPFRSHQPMSPMAMSPNDREISLNSSFIDPPFEPRFSAESDSDAISKVSEQIDRSFEAIMHHVDPLNHELTQQISRENVYDL